MYVETSNNYECIKKIELIMIKYIVSGSQHNLMMALHWIRRGEILANTNLTQTKYC